MYGDSMANNIVDTILLEQIDNPAALFVFPTNVAASRWADHVLRLRHNEANRAGTVAMEKFIAWDTFKQDSIRSKVTNRHSIPSVLRKMFIGALIRENAEQCAQGKPPVFVSLIRAEYAQQAGSSASWLTEILPQLGAWFKQTTGLPVAQMRERVAMQTADKFAGDDVSSDDDVSSGDDRDLFTLTLRYAQFLEEHELFEPAWETPPFEDTGKECFIFFPESLSDFNEYRELLAASDHVQTISVNNVPEKHDDVFFYTNSRSEITEAALYILALRDNHHIPWDSISVSIPDDEHYGPYLFREFENRNIPYVRQSGKPLASYPAGQFFAAIAQCSSADFSFGSIKELLLNRHLPWKDRDTIQSLVEFGIKNNCISSWVENEDGRETPVNVWEDAFTHPFGGIDPQIRRFFIDLKRRVTALCSADSFAEMRKHYFVFREYFFDMANCLEETDLILSRCISELTYLIEIEKSFPHVFIPDHYTFFTEYLQEVNYLAQQSAIGVSILPYRTAAPAPFDCHIVLGASQSSLSAVFSPLSFLPKSKREKLGIIDHDASLVFINLHRFNSRLPAVFFCSEQTFSGYAIPHSALDAPANPQQRYGVSSNGQFAADLYREESNFYASLHSSAQGQTETAIPPKIHRNQKQGFEEWQLRREHAATLNDKVLPPDHPLLRKIRDRFCSGDESKAPFRVSASSLAQYFQCPLLWIFSRVLYLENVEIETGLMASYIAGDVYHSILSLFLHELKETGEVIAAPVNHGTEKKPLFKLSQSYANLLTKKTETVFESFPRLPNSKYQEMSMLTARLLRAEKSLFLSRLEDFLAAFTAHFAGFTVVATEEAYTSAQDNYLLNGRIDCILSHSQNSVSFENGSGKTGQKTDFSREYEAFSKDSLAIVDFKTKYKKEEGVTDYQLPLYLKLAEIKYKKDVQTALFFSIIDTKSSALFETMQEKNDVMREFDEKAAQFVQELSTGAFPFAPFHPDQCHDCGHNKVCRTLYKVSQGYNNGT
jgi:hypothetical protein